MNTSDIVSKIITERNYINCPKWLLNLVDYDSFTQMTDNMGEFIISYNTDNNNNYKPFSAEYRGLINVIQSYSHRSDIFTARNIITYLTGHNPLLSGIPYIVAYYLTSKNHWLYFVKTAWKSWGKYMRDSTITRILTTIASMSQIPNIAFDAILCHVNCSVVNMLHGNIVSMDNQKGLLLTYNDVLPKTERYGVDYVNCYVKIIISAIIRKYCGTSECNIMLRTKIINTIWNKGIPYFPDNGTDEEAIMMVNIFSDNDSDKALPSTLIKHIQSYVTKVKNDCDTELLNDLIERLLKLAANNVNNTKFLHTVANLGLTICSKVNAFIMTDAIRTVTNHSRDSKPLYDFKSLCGNANKCSYSSYILSYAELQHEFIIQGGLPSSLFISHVHAKSCYLYDPDNLPIIFKYASYNEMKKLLLDDTIRSMTSEYVIGRQPMYPVIRKIIEVGIDLVKEGNIELSKLLAEIETNYPIRSESDLDKYRLMIADNFPFILLHQFKKQYEDTAPYLPIYCQDYSDFISMVKKRNCYVPVNFGVVNYTECHPIGLENYMSYDQIKSLVDVSWGYVGDVNLPDLGKKLIDFIKAVKMYENS